VLKINVLKKNIFFPAISEYQTAPDHSCEQNSIRSHKKMFASMKQTMQAKATLPFQFNHSADRNKPAGRFRVFRLFASTLFIATLCILTAARPAGPAPAIAKPLPPSLTCALPAPSSLSAIRTGSTTASVEWSAVSGAVSYSLKVYDLNTLVLVSSTVEQGSSTTVSGLEPGKNYRAVLAAMCSGGSISEFVIVEDIVD